MTCEKCWSDAYLKSRMTGKSQGECYYELLEERKNNPCTSVEQAGQFWDDKLKCDRRLIEK